MLFEIGHRRNGAAGRQEQLLLELTAPPTSGEELLAVLRGYGLERIATCQLTKNHSVMVSYRGSELRVHEGYLGAPAHVHHAIVRLVEGRTREERRVAQRTILSFTVPAAGNGRRRPLRRETTRPVDEPLAERFVEWHARYNGEHFGHALRRVPVRVSRRMRSRLGHYIAAANGDAPEIAISWRHLRRHGWGEALQTLLHEMVHQWQDENGHPIDHGPMFRAKARDVGIDASARRRTD